jgi:cysteinyl-tRNA synthetase
MGQYEAADAIRDRLIELGIEVKDSAAGTAYVV